uniref:Uncharacterized protein n=1 Tax=Chromera velia CCMP2878 TaxID=1169474 RepID=A0A0G4I7I1_9ALVE|eukprot:Cvel_1938.t1-p1 / transcript=Cvel_1938.t1 / gene=Cvel_1938 / organism=Chromera_velia_CCMP2878 / gene_product=hypothetical protein / transcript_product=hypothetical protein / location=Cvel_scaffold73:32886-33556(-) / protein_length=153 / sequence_SO=supercontig / SO=protein_coding / is_pseudo=false
MGREEAIAGWKQWEETAGCCSSPVLPTGVDGPRVTASRSRGSRGTARICSGGQEEDEEEWCLNCYQHSGSRFHQGHQGAESGSRGQVCLDEHVEQRLPGPRDVDETGPSACCLPSCCVVPDLLSGAHTCHPFLLPPFALSAWVVVFFPTSPRL